MYGVTGYNSQMSMVQPPGTAMYGVTEYNTQMVTVQPYVHMVLPDYNPTRS